MWNAQLGALMGGTTVCIFDGNPGGTRERPDWGTLWRFASLAKATLLRRRRGLLRELPEGRRRADARGRPVAPAHDRLHRLAAVGRVLRLDLDHLPQVDGAPIWLAPIAGGTDFAGAFLGGNRTLPVVKGEMQCRCLGAAVEAYGEPDANGVGKPLIDEVGELVCTRPMPSMPLFFWGDTDGKRLRESYFEMYRHPTAPASGATATGCASPPRGGAIIYGRSDATINRHGIRMGTAELYRAVEALPEVLDSLVVDLEYLGRESYMPLFVVLREGLTLDDALTRRLREAIKTALSARHVPNEIFQVDAIPRTLSGKKMELPVKKLLQGADAAEGAQPRRDGQRRLRRLVRRVRAAQAGRRRLSGAGAAVVQPLSTTPSRTASTPLPASSATSASHHAAMLPCGRPRRCHMPCISGVAANQSRRSGCGCEPFLEQVELQQHLGRMAVVPRRVGAKAGQARAGARQRRRRRPGTARRGRAAPTAPAGARSGRALAATSSNASTPSSSGKTTPKPFSHSASAEISTPCAASNSITESRVVAGRGEHLPGAAAAAQRVAGGELRVGREALATLPRRAVGQRLLVPAQHRLPLPGRDVDGHAERALQRRVAAAVVGVQVRVDEARQRFARRARGAPAPASARHARSARCRPASRLRPARRAAARCSTTASRARARSGRRGRDAGRHHYSGSSVK